MPDKEWTCCICGSELGEKWHLSGRDYCAGHAKDVPRQRFGGVFDEAVRGIIIGQITNHYQFWRGGTKLAEGDFEHDYQAIEWFKENHPTEFKSGAEMKVLL